MWECEAAPVCEHLVVSVKLSSRDAKRSAQPRAPSSRTLGHGLQCSCHDSSPHYFSFALDASPDIVVHYSCPSHRCQPRAPLGPSVCDPVGVQHHSRARQHGCLHVTSVDIMQRLRVPTAAAATQQSLHRQHAREETCPQAPAERARHAHGHCCDGYHSRKLRAGGYPGA